ncbi:hypothetical protein [Amycolatopsis circi]|uniref:hypothetical protein n=1 Tax=Amycolatopsis circi TaxID=871959 RepID=UPI001ABFF770|nr:hypothetical protein [Amycolatopsis circi]
MSKPPLKTEGYGGHPMKLQIHRRPQQRLTTWLRDAGFTIETELLLDPQTPAPQAILTARSR